MQNGNGRPSFSGKLFLLLPRPTRTCPKDIGHQEILGYGELLYRSRLSLKTKPTDLAAAMGCERWHTLPKIVKQLQAHGLADDQLRPLPDEKNYFHRKRTQKRRWQDQLQATVVYRLCPDAELTNLQNSILWTVHSFNSAGQRPYPKSIAKLLRLDARTVVKHLAWLQEHHFLDQNLNVVADPRHWQDGKPKLAGDPEIRWEEFAAKWVASRFGDGDDRAQLRFADYRWQLRRWLKEGCEAMAEAGYGSTQIRDYWEREVPEACGAESQLVLTEYFVRRLFWPMFEAVEKATKHNRQMGTFHGDSSDGLLRRITAGQIRAMRARLFEGGVQGLELWTPDLTSLGTTKRQPNMQAVGVSVSSGPKIRYDREAFVRLLRDRAPELDREAWLERIVASRQFEDDAEQLYLDCWQALNDRATRQGRNLERLLGEGNGKA